MSVYLMGVLEYVLSNLTNHCKYEVPSKFDYRGGNHLEIMRKGLVRMPRYLLLALKKHRNSEVVGPQPERQLELFMGSPTYHMPSGFESISAAHQPTDYVHKLSN